MGDFEDNNKIIDDDDDVYINPTDGLPNQHPSLPDGYDFEEENNEELIDPDSFDDLPKSLIVTNIHSSVFVNADMKEKMENLFRTFSDDVTFQWLKSFRRLRVNYEKAVDAANARIHIHQFPFDEQNIISCYFAQPVTPVANPNLKPPPLTKQFLISPPTSPPAGWEPRDENEPLVNHDLLAALASLTPGETHEIHAQSDNHPGIILHTPELGKEELDEQNGTKLQMVQTKCPERSS